MPKKKSSKVGLPALECCTGCAACVDSCTVTAIKMMPDECGFLYPVLNHDRCVECQACLKACPVNSTAIERGDFYAYLAWSPLRHASSSGGIFPTLAQKAIEKGETVIAVAWKDIAHLHFIEVDTPEKLAQCLGSKYLQCNAEGVYRRVGELLNAGKHVLFFGMPCQAAAMRHRFINHSNLSIVDFACHGVPSEQMWGDYLKEAHADWRQIKKVDFRDKRHGWRADTLSASMQDGSWQVWPYENNAYEQAFHTNLSLRTSCYDCPFAEPPHWSDLTLADFWGVDQLSDEPLAGEGANLLLVNTAKGRSIVEEIKSRLVCFEEVNVEKAIAPNRFKKKIEMAHGRNEFLKKYPKLGFCESVNQSLHGKRDIGVIGCWSIENHGSNMSYFALYHFLREKGYSVLMIERPADSLWPPVGQPLGFNTQVYEPEDLSPVYLNKFEMRVLNTQCDTFVLGSDQLLYHDLYRSFSRFIGMQYIYDNKKKIAYATSLGRDSFEGDEQMRARTELFFKAI